jgi:hypothetical protein
LSHIVHDIDVGKDEVVRTPLGGDVPAVDILDEFTSSVYLPGMSQLNMQLQELEEGQKQKFGPRSLQKPWSERRESFLETFDTKPEVPDNGFRIRFPGYGRLRPSDLVTAGKSLKRTTSSGLPYLIRKGEVLDGNLPIELGLDLACVLFTRTQEGNKTRPVWGYPITMTLLEALYFVPYFEKLKAHPCMSAYGGPDAVDEAITVLLNRKEHDHVIFSEDYSSFDHSISTGWSRRQFNNIRNAFQDSDKITNDFEVIADYFTRCGIITPDGILAGEHGIPSGSMYTSVQGSSCHLEAQHAIRNDVHPYANQVMGDDGVSVQPPSIDEEYLANVYSEFNLTFNKDKTFVSKDEVLYLQRYYSPDYRFGGVYRGIYPVYRALNRLIHMERWTNMQAISGPDYFSIRAIAILENCKWHPLHEPFVKWVVSKDKYSLEYTDQGLREYVRAFQTKSGTGVGNQYSDNIAGVAKFETVKIVQRM